MKYIVEFEDEPCMYEDEVHFYKCIQAPWWGLSERVIKQLTPYQPDIAPDTNVGNITNSCAHEKDHNADIGKKVERTGKHSQDVSDSDLISRKAAIEALARMMPRSYTPDGSHPADEEIFRAQEVIADCIEALEILTPAQPDNQTNLCDSCDCSYPDCPSKYDDVIFGNGIGNDNICACNKYKPSAQPEQKKDEWIPISKETNPTKSGWYLVTVHEDATNDNERFTGMAEFNAINGMWYDIGEPTDMYLRWMPLPAPYRGGEMT